LSCHSGTNNYILTAGIGRHDEAGSVTDAIDSHQRRLHLSKRGYQSSFIVAL
jgi:hypothetical protein